MGKKKGGVGVIGGWGGEDLSYSGSKIGTEVEVVKVKERLFSLVCGGMGTVWYLD